MNKAEWTIIEVESWLKEVGLGRFVGLFCEDHEIDGKALLALTENDLRLPPLQLSKLGDIKKLWMRIHKLQLDHEKLNGSDASNESNSAPNPNLLTPPPSAKRRRHRLGNGTGKQSFSLYSASSDGSSADDEMDGHLTFELRNHTNGRQRVVFNPEYGKTFASFIYGVVSMFTTAYTMVLVNERVPDKQKHPPLPDIFLDNVPLIPYAFKMAEMCGLVLMAMLFSILVFHKHRWIVLRRIYSIGSTVFLLRCITMFVTSLSVPGDHLQCQSARYDTTHQRLGRALEIFCGGGMTLNGVNTCGDYMFSGHTVVLTLFNHFITEYTPSRWSSIHIISWVLNLFGIFFILAGHEHYSIDVVIAFYITSRIFLYYHMLANTRSYLHSKRIRIWFPLLSYFECNVPGKLPNEYEWPLSTEKLKSFHSSVKKWLATKPKKIL